MQPSGTEDGEMLGVTIKNSPSLFLVRSLTGYHSFTCISDGKVLGITRLVRKPRGYCSNLINRVNEIFEEMLSFQGS